MKIFKWYLMILYCLVILFPVPVIACWVHLSASELEEIADLVVIGRYNGNMAEEPDRYYGARSWVVEVEHFLKGFDQNTIEIVTPGSSLTEIQVSLEYKLTDIADGHMLLYLHKTDDGKYTPITPHGGIVNLEAVPGGRILNTYNVLGRDADETYEIEESIKSMTGNEGSKTFQTVISAACGLILLGVILLVILNRSGIKIFFDHYFQNTAAVNQNSSNLSVIILLYLAAALLIAAALLLYFGI